MTTKGLIMSYLKDFLTQIHNRDFHKFLVLWEEYCTSDVVEAEEFSQLLMAIKSSEMAKHFGQIVETALPLWRTIEDKKDSYDILRLLIDLQTTNSETIVDLVLETLQKYHENDPKFSERLRLAGLRDKQNFKGAISKYDLLAHMLKGNMVFHTGGWGTGEIIDASFVREHLIIEFENVSGRKDLSFENAFKTLIPLSNHHFLARRFADPDLLEKEGREDPVKIIKIFLHDMGPKTAGEIKEELCELVIPETSWTKWWQGTRAKIKKDSMIETPDTIKDPFYLRKAELSPEEQLKIITQDKKDVNEVIQTTYNFVRDKPSSLKTASIKNTLQDKLTTLLENGSLKEEQMLQIHLLLEQFFGYQSTENPISQIIKNHSFLENLVQNVDIVAFKKRTLIAIKEFRSDWPTLFLEFLFVLPQTQLRDYLLKELNKPEYLSALEEKLQKLLHHPIIAPEMFFWYFQKLIGEKEQIPFQNKSGKETFFESFFILIHAIESRPEYRDLSKKMYNLLADKRYALVRQMISETPLEYVQEFLLLTSKCQIFTDHDLKVLRSLAEVAQPSLAPVKSRRGSGKEGESEIWTTEEGYLKVQERIKHIGTIEVVENAREIEAARALGDLRENSEFKFAQERRARLQSELKTLSDQLSKARIITPYDIPSHEVGIGNVIDVTDKTGKHLRFTILGPWDADPDLNILSYNSKFAQAMTGKKKGEDFNFKEDDFKIVDFTSYLNK